MIPLNNIKTAVMAVLKEKYGAEMPLYGEDILEGVSRPCFFVKVLPAASSKERGLYRNRNVLVAISYLPDPDDERPRNSAHAVYDDLDNDLFASALPVNTDNEKERYLLPGDCSGQFLDGSLSYSFALSWIDTGKPERSEVEYDENMETLEGTLEIGDGGEAPLSGSEDDETTP